MKPHDTPFRDVPFGRRGPAEVRGRRLGDGEAAGPATDPAGETFPTARAQSALKREAFHPALWKRSL